MLSSIIPHLWYLSAVRRRQEAEQERRQAEQELQEAKQARRQAEQALRETKTQLAAATAPHRRRHRRR